METEQTDEVPEGIQQVQILQPGDISQGETITLSLENAAQLILQQHGLQGDEEGQLQPGTYQIITQQLAPGGDGQMQVALANGISVIQAADAADLSAYGLGQQGIILQAGTGDNDTEQILQVPDRLVQPENEQITYNVTAAGLLDPSTLQQHQQKGENSHDDFDGQSEHVLQIDLPVSESESMLQVINQPLPQAVGEPSLETDNTGTMLMTSEGNYAVRLVQQPHYTVKEELDEGEEPDYTATDIQQEEDTMDTETQIPEQPDLSQEEDMDLKEDTDPTNPTTLSADTITTKKVTLKTEKPAKMPDLTRPIEVTDHMEVVVGGKKCLLKVNPDTGQLCAYPLITTTSSGKKRGRPKKSEVQSKLSADEDGIEDGGEMLGKEEEQANSAAEGLLELSNTGPDGVRRSGRARKKAKTLDDYDMLEVSSDDEGAAEEVEDEVLPSGAIRKRKPNQKKDMLPESPMPTPGVKRGRGRPRRYPRPEDTATVNQIPAMIIPSGDGQTIMMAPIQGLTNLEAFQEQVKNLSIFQQAKTELPDEAAQYLNTSNILSLDDGTQINIQLGNPDVQKLALDGDGIDDKSFIKQETSVLEDTDLPIEKGTDLLTENEDDSSLTPPSSSLADTDSITLNQDASLKVASTSDDGQATIIQIPENLLPMFMQKKDPIKLGLKATDSHLEKWKCSKCGYQAYYSQQYQNHLLTHPDDTIKCKCCSFVTFEFDDLLEHFKTTHPRCICNVCNHMAEHAYIIKRHMMRHTQEGCTCDICGKVYKDQYVLKMHVKMVHLPAEVLFECNVCSKKFTRKAHLKRHLRIHDPQKPFKCPHCQYRGCEKSDISKHLLIHEDPKHTCDVCGKTFRHIKNKDLHLKRHTGQRDYKCGVCEFYGYTFTDIRKHIERKHSDTKTYLCDKCGSAFKSEQLLREHRTQQCDVFMIEQALSIATSDGGTSHATIQIPSTLSLEGQHLQIDGQNLQIDGQNISIDNQGHITVEHVSLPEDALGLTEEQLQAAGVSQGTMSDTELQAVVAHGQITDIGHGQGEIIGTIGGSEIGEVVEAGYTGVVEEDEEAEDIEDMDEDEMNERMQDLVDNEKQNLDNDAMLEMVQIMR